MEAWYYDACALKKDKSTYGEFFNKNNAHEVVVSHLSIGEAFGNCLSKGKETAESFIELIDDLKTKLKERLKIVPNSNIEDILDDIEDNFEELEITDAIHLATAIRCRCCILRTADRDLHGLPQNKIKEIARRFGVDPFSITEVSLGKGKG